MRRPSRRAMIWLLTGVSLASLAAMFSNTAPGSAIDIMVQVLAWVWLAISAALVLRFLWLWFTYRIGVRLFLSYLLIGVTPFVFCAALAGSALYVFMGQYTLLRLDAEMARLRSGVASSCRDALAEYQQAGTPAAIAQLQRLSAQPPLPLPRVLWLARLAGEELRSDGAEALPVPTWVGHPLPDAAVWKKQAYVVTAAVASDDVIVGLVPLDERTAQALGQAQGFEVNFVFRRHPPSEQLVLGDVTIPIELFRSPSYSTSGGLWRWPFILWFRQAATVVDLASGQAMPGGSELLSLLRTAPASVFRNFCSGHALAPGLSFFLFFLAVLALVFIPVYGLAVAVAGTMVLSITRSTARLTLGTRAVQKGNLDHRIPVVRRDQLGDLAAAFNGMSQSVQNMLADVAEKERLAAELQLARQIQEDLLPDRHVEHGELEVFATCRPAAEVGGDYFDIFPMSGQRMAVAIGDVAGHGLSTGLLMAALKSAVAALVHEGYGGKKLLAKVNHLLREQSHSRTMATLALAEVALAEDQLVITNAAHPPAFLLTPDGEVEEIMVGSLPVGTRLCKPTQRQVSFPPGSRLVLYSDGLVEAVGASGDLFGYQALHDLLAANSELSGREVATKITRELDSFMAGKALADDLTILVIQRSNGLGRADVSLPMAAGPPEQIPDPRPGRKVVS